MSDAGDIQGANCAHSSDNAAAASADKVAGVGVHQ